MSNRLSDDTAAVAGFVILVAGAVLYVSVLRALWAITSHFSR